MEFKEILRNSAELSEGVLILFDSGIYEGNVSFWPKKTTCCQPLLNSWFLNKNLTTFDVDLESVVKLACSVSSTFQSLTSLKVQFSPSAFCMFLVKKKDKV